MFSLYKNAICTADNFVHEYDPGLPNPTAGTRDLFKPIVVAAGHAS